MDFVFKTLAVAADHAGYALKEHLKEYAASLNLSIIDLGTHSEASVDYPDYAQKVSQAILDQQADGGLLICGSGIGISMAANRYAGIRAAVCNDGVSAVRLSRQHNDANILCLGARLIGLTVAQDCLFHFVTTPFEGGDRHRRRIEKIERNF